MRARAGHEGQSGARSRSLPVHTTECEVEHGMHLTAVDDR